MLGEFLEYSIASEPLATAVEFYCSLGFTETPTSDLVAEPYIALTHGPAAVGVRQAGLPGIVPTFVRPNLREHLRGLRRLQIPLELAELADEQFHRAAFEDPNGQLILLVEARTRGPRVGNPAPVSTLGEFVEFSVATASVVESRTFWERLGLRAVAEGDRPGPWTRLEGHGFTVGMHEGRSFPAGLTFSAANLAARAEFLGAQGHSLRREVPFAENASSGITLHAPGGQPIYVLAND